MGRVALLFMLLAATWGRALAQVSDPLQQEALQTVRRYAQDMTMVIPCSYMGMPPTLWDKTYGEVDIKMTLEEYGKRGASPAQVEALRQAYDASFRPRWFGDIRIMARACYSNKVFEALNLFSGPALPLFLRPPFNKRP